MENSTSKGTMKSSAKSASEQKMNPSSRTKNDAEIEIDEVSFAEGGCPCSSSKKSW